MEEDIPMTDTPIENDNNIEDRKATVSIRNMSLSLWYKAGYKCKTQGQTLSDYIANLIEKDLEQNPSND
jgi:macrodomain Ter protein organizer (MatP/YcbG family)